MLDRQLRALIDPALDRIGSTLALRGVTANAVTLTGLALGLLGALAIIAGHFMLALAALAANRLCDGLDGAVARARGRTITGGFLDITSDFVVYGAVPLAFAIHDPGANALAAAALLFSFYINGAAFLAFATLAAQNPALAERDPRKSFRYLWGLAEGAETIAIFSAMLLLPALFAPLAWGFAALCTVSAIARIVHASSLAKDHPSPPADRE
jgi:phosphatidylglycerophosphate synthase